MQTGTDLNIETDNGKKFDRIKTAAGIFGACFVFIITFIIISNTLNLSGNYGLSEPEKIMEHFINVHKINELPFGFINIDLSSDNYSYNDTDHEITFPASSVFYVITVFIILFISTNKKSFPFKKLSFVSGYKNSIFIPPENLF